jgi:hypothetical protein
MAQATKPIFACLSFLIFFISIYPPSGYCRLNGPCFKISPAYAKILVEPGIAHLLKQQDFFVTVNVTPNVTFVGLEVLHQGR